MIRDHNIIQCLAWLTDVHAEVKRLSPKTHLRKDAWVQHHHDDFWEFNGPDKFQTSVTTLRAQWDGKRTCEKVAQTNKNKASASERGPFFFP